VKNNKSNQTNNIVVITLFLTYIFITGIVTLNNNKTRFINTYNLTVEKEEFKKYDINEKYNNLKANLESVFSSNIVGKYKYIDIYGQIQNMMQKKVVEDVEDNKRVIKLSNDDLTFIYPDKDVTNWINKISAVSDYSKENNIYMLYANAPWKVAENAKLPFYLKDYVTNVKNNFITGIEKNKVNIINLEEKLEGNVNEWFFKTDHHWNIETAFNAYELIMKNIDKNVEINLQKKYLNDYSKRVYKDIFLGTYGKRVGKYYVGVDDFSYILPNFKTSLDVINNIDWDKESSHLIGEFEKVFTYPEYLENDELDRKMSTYYTYSEGTKAEVKISNLKAYNNKKILILKDSFADPIYPFISLNFKETRVIDVRRFRAIRLYSYIEKFEPDVILFIHTPSSLYDDSLINFQLK